MYIEYSIREEERIHKSIFNNTHTPMLIIDDESGKIKDANIAACHYYGYAKDELLKLRITDINMLSPQEVFEEMERARTEKRKYFRFKHRLADGRIKDVEVYSGPVTFDNKSLLFSIIHDIQEKTDMERKMQVQESYFADLYENSPEAIAILDNEFRIISTNKSFERIFQYTLEEVEGQNITVALCDEKQYDVSEYIKDCVKRGEFVRKETLRKRKDGKLIDVSLLAYPIISHGEQIGIYAIYSDLTKVKEAESKKKLFAEIFKNNTVGVVVTDVEGNIQWINDAFTKTTGFTPEEVVGKNPNILKSEKHDLEFYSNMWNAILNAGKWQGEIWNKRKNGEIYQEWLNIIAIRDDNGNIEHFVGMIHDLTDARQKDNKIEILTSKDSLTDLYNRDFFINKLNYEILKKSKREDKNAHKGFAVVFLDIDDFKEINDTLGHLVGDCVLKEFAFRLKSSIRENDIVARFGGDEFIVLLSSLYKHYEVIHIANRILDAIGKPLVIENRELHMTASLGIARYPDDGTDPTTLIRNADIAMYRSKEGKSKKITMFESSLDAEIQEYYKVKTNLRNAVPNNELFLVYQPIFDVRKNVIVGAEALLRWKYDNKELIEPSRFIPIAEKTDLMHEIGEWVLKTACEQNKAWQNQGYQPIVISVNVSIIQLEQPDFFEIVKRVLKETGLEPAYLQLEITETVFTKNYDKIVQAVKVLSQMGIKMVIDDFGTGYSSLGQLSRLEISKLKIDRSFICELSQNENKSKIVKAIISLAESLNLELIAEGVETKEQLDFLKRNACRMVQGYLYSRPTDPDSIINYLRRLNCIKGDRD